MMILYSKHNPERESSQKFVAIVRHQINETCQIEKESEYIDNSRYYHRYWTTASETTSSKL